jgi:UDP-N-acetylmuramyl pentapeptide phosphotransferase/UDP-N-acetylglucosamine-1-phosphate transferase
LTEALTPVLTNIYGLPFALTLVVALGISGYLSLYGTSLGKDKQAGVQKFHTRPTSRLGGVAIAAGMVVGVWMSGNYYPNDSLLGLWLLLISLPVFLGGLAEDLTHKVSPRMRLILACASSALAYWVFRVGVTRTDIAWIDWALGLPGMSLLLTMLVVAGFINAVNIIDGFHGLASGSVIVMLLGLAGLAWIASDGLVLRLCIVTAAATLGFAIWNWPFGKIFLGDGGAYLLGLWVVELGLLIPHRSIEISPMAPVLVGVYPLLETLYSMYRRKFVRSHPINHPDALHLHTLIYRRLILNPALDVTSDDKNRANAKVAVLVWGFAATPGVCALLFYKNTTMLLTMVGFFAIAYVVFYKRLVGFKAPVFLMSSRRRIIF